MEEGDATNHNLLEEKDIHKKIYRALHKEEDEW
jgi:hypothetical protein